MYVIAENKLLFRPDLLGLFQSWPSLYTSCNRILQAATPHSFEVFFPARSSSLSIMATAAPTEWAMPDVYRSGITCLCAEVLFPTDDAIQR